MVTSFPQGEIELIQPLQTADIKGKFGIDIEAAQPFLCIWGLAAAPACRSWASPPALSEG